MANKKTQKDFFNEIIEVLNEIGRDDLVEFCEDRIDKLSKKSSSKKPTKTQVENEEIAAIVVTVLEELGTPTTASGIALDPRVPTTNTQKLVPILKKLVAEGKVVRTEEKGRAYFSIALTEDEED